MNRVTELYVEKATRIRALGLLGRIGTESIIIAHENPNSDMNKLLSEFGELVPDYYVSDYKIKDKIYKLSPFIDSQSLISMVAEAEAFFQDTLVEIICCYPEKIGRLKIDVSKLKELGNVNEAIRFVAQEYSRDLFYKRPNEYQKEMISILSAKDDLLDEHWPQYVEAKARRDLGVHNSWKINEIYISKIREVGLQHVGGSELTVKEPLIKSHDFAILRPLISRAASDGSKDFGNRHV